MPWRVSTILHAHTRFIRAHEAGDLNMTELCRQFGISRKTGYKLLARYAADGVAGLGEQSRAPHTHPNQTPEDLAAEILAQRRLHPSWGPRKLRARLHQLQPDKAWPAASTIGHLLQSNGLCAPRRLRRRTPPMTSPLGQAQAPNDIWCFDFKGWFRTGNGERVDPFTATDAASRYLLRCQAVEKTNTEAISSICLAMFREYGLPWAIRSDNGAPFASRAIAGLSRLSVEWIKLGIRPERIRPGHPEENGQHERMHRTLKAETTAPAEHSRRAQQRRFDSFRKEFNQERPHEALDMNTPASVYAPSTRICPELIPDPDYDQHLCVRTVAPHGQFFWKGRDVFLTKALSGERIGLEEIDNDLHLVWFAAIPVALFDPVTMRVSPLPKEEREDVEAEKQCEGYGNQEIANSAIP